MARRIGNTQTPSAAGLSDIVNLKQNRNYVKDDIYPTPDNDALGSVRFDGTSSYLTRTPSTAGNQKTWTWSGWVKPRDFTDGSIDCIWSQKGGTATAQRNALYNNATNGNLIFTHYTGIVTTVTEFHYITTQVFRDPNSWYHIVIATDTTLATASDRIKIYVNGVRITAFDTETTPSQDLDTYVNNGTYDIQIGVDTAVASARYYAGYLSEFHLVDGLALDPTYFGYTDRETGQWKPKRYTGNFGTNGFYLPMSGDFKAGYTRAGIGDYDNTNLENNKADIYSATAATFTSVWKAHEGKWGKSSWSNNHGKIELTADDAYNLKDVSATPFTIEGWTKWVEEDGIFSFLASFGTGDYSALSVWYNGTLNEFYLTGDTTGSIGWDIDNSISLDPYDGEWHHWAFTRNTSGQYKFHYDGVYKGIIATNTSDLVTNNNTVKIFSHYKDTTQVGANYQIPFVYHDSMRLIKGQDLYGTSDIAGWSADIWNIASTKETYVGSGTDLTGTVSFLLPPNRYDAPFREISGRNNNFRIESVGAHDTVKDSPQNTFATLNIPASTSGVFTEGNLKYVTTQDIASSTLGASSGLFYFEVYIDTSNNNYIGILDISQGQNPLRGGSGWNQHGALAYKADGTQYILPIGGTSSVSSYGGTMSSGDIIGVAFDIDKDTLTFYKNGISQGNTTYGPSYISNDGIFGGFVYGGTSSSSGATFNLNFGQDHTFAGAKSALTTPYTDANGIGEFYYPPPDGALALCTQNLESGLKNTTVEKKYYNRDETGKVLSYEGYNDYTYGTINDERFSDASPYASSYGGKSFAFDGTQSVITLDHDDFYLGSGEWTVEFWVYFNAIAGTMRIAGQRDASATQSSGGLLFEINSSSPAGGMKFYLYDSIGSNLLNLSSSAIEADKWYHVAVARDGDTIRGWINGTNSGTTVDWSSKSVQNGTGIFALGAQGAFPNDKINGYISDFRIVKGDAIYTGTGNFTPPTAPLSSVSGTGITTSFLTQPYNTETVNNTTPMYPRDEVGKILDYNDGVNFVNVSPYADNSVKSFDFDGSDDYLTIGNNKDDYKFLHDGTESFTMECWIYRTTDNNAIQTIFDNCLISSGNLGVSFWVQADDTLRFAIFFGTGGQYIVNTPTTQTIGFNQWYHVCVTMEYGSVNQLKYYINGISAGTVSKTNTNSTSSAYSVSYIGSTTANTYNFPGYITDFRIVKGIAYTGAFTPPSGKLTTTGGTYPSTTNVNTSITAGDTVFLAQPYSQPATILDSGSQYRTNRIYQTDETGNNLTYV